MKTDASAFFGGYRAGNSPAHRMPVWSKYLLVLLVGVTPFFSSNSGGFPWAAWWWPSSSTWLLPRSRCARRYLLVCRCGSRMLSYSRITVFFTMWQRGVIYVAGLLACLYIARLVTCTTDPGALMDAIVALARPLRPLGAKPEKFALTIALMWTTIPYLVGSIGQVREAAKARGLERYSWRFLIPMFVGAVGHALEIGEALKARGLGDEEPF
ncbi:transmembrane component BioN of energizing module of biotin ECF transporter [Cutibacterium acnes JCM 18909]|nr:transmembrane component BioN of energizing module of biotin ECF transporter [Cutibacterium acnes JCM 18909]